MAWYASKCPAPSTRHGRDRANQQQERGECWDMERGVRVAPGATSIRRPGDPAEAEEAGGREERRPKQKSIPESTPAVSASGDSGGRISGVASIVPVPIYYSNEPSIAGGDLHGSLLLHQKYPAGAAPLSQEFLPSVTGQSFHTYVLFGPRESQHW